MINGESQVSRKTLNEDRIAICPQYGCKNLEKVKPLKFGILGFRKYPKCSKHKIPLIFVDEFIGDFLGAVNACLFDISSIPPKNLRSVIKIRFPNELITFINGWMYCIPIGRGAQIVSQYMDGLSRAYMKLLSRKQKKALKNEKSSTKRFNMLRLALKKIADEYTAFLQELRENSEFLYDPENLHSLSKDMQKLLKKWLKDHLKTIKSLNNIEQSKSSIQEDFLLLLKEEYDKVLHAGTCALLLGKNPSIVTKAVPAFELFSAYYEFLKAGICRKINKADVKSLIEETQDSLNDNEKNLTDNQENEEKDLITELDNINMVYKTKDFIKDLKSELKKLVPFEELRGGRLSDRALSRILGQDENYIRDWVKASTKRNPKYRIAIDRLNEFILNLRSKFGERINKIIEINQKYIDLNDLPNSNRTKIYNSHPNIDLDYFKEINTKEKAYWLGFIYADACITRIHGYLTRFDIALNIKDEIIIDRFAEAVGLNLEYKKYRNRENSQMVSISFSNRRFVNNLIKQGVLERKSKILELPEFYDYELNLAFLLGLFDGDGTEGRTTLTSGSKELLKQIKKKNKLPFNIRKVENELGTVYRLSLGGELFNEMMANYEYSLERKRKRFNKRRDGLYDHFKQLITKEELKTLVWQKSFSKLAEQFKVQRYHISKLVDEWDIDTPSGLGFWNVKNLKRYNAYKQFMKSMSREILQELVWKAPISKLAEKYGIHLDHFYSLIKKWNIKTPPSGYWNQKKFLNNRSKYLL